MKIDIPKIGLIFGSDTGITEEVTNIILEKWEDKEISAVEVTDVSPEYFDDYEFLILGLSTWYDGDLQSDWESFLDDFKSVDFTGKTVALFGLGDQIGYGEYFIDGVGILSEIIIEKGGKIIGNWSIDGYEFTESKAQMNSTHFYGLAIDEDTQSDLTNERVDQWLKILEEEYKN